MDNQTIIGRYKNICISIYLSEKIFFGIFNKLLDIYINIWYNIIVRKITYNTNNNTEENFMTIESYMDIMKWVFQTQIERAKEEANKETFSTEYMEGYYGGIVRGLEIALEKINASVFLAKK